MYHNTLTSNHHRKQAACRLLAEGLAVLPASYKVTSTGFSSVSSLFDDSDVVWGQAFVEGLAVEGKLTELTAALDVPLQVDNSRVLEDKLVHLADKLNLTSYLTLQFYKRNDEKHPPASDTPHYLTECSTDDIGDHDDHSSSTNHKRKHREDPYPLDEDNHDDASPTRNHERKRAKCDLEDNHEEETACLLPFQEEEDPVPTMSDITGGHDVKDDAVDHDGNDALDHDDEHMREWADEWLPRTEELKR